MSVTLAQLQQLLLDGEPRFSKTLARVKELLGEPKSMRFLPDSLSRDQLKVVVYTYQADDGVAEIFCPVELRKTEEWAVNAWIIVQHAAGTEAKKPGVETLSKGLFDDAAGPVKERPKTKENWRAGFQMRLGEGMEE